MPSITQPSARRRAVVPPLVDGDHLSRDEFERRYEAMPDLKGAQLIEGVVYMPSPIRVRKHGRPQVGILTWMGNYVAATPGTDCSAPSSVRLDFINMPEPDGLLWIEPECGGQAFTDEDDYLQGAPELLAEVAATRKDREVGPKLQAYQRNRVREYIICRIKDQAVDWFVLRQGRFRPLRPDSAGIFKSKVFPGLWLDAPALIRGDLARVLQVLQQGLATPEHAAFVAKLARRAARKANR